MQYPMRKRQGTEFNNDEAYQSEFWRCNIDFGVTHGDFCAEDLYGPGLRYVMTRLQVNQAWLVRETGIDKTTISHYVIGDRIPGLKNAEKMFNALIYEIKRQTGRRFI